jgi:hypothetical protein
MKTRHEVNMAQAVSDTMVAYKELNLTDEEVFVLEFVPFCDELVQQMLPMFGYDPEEIKMIYNFDPTDPSYRDKYAHPTDNTLRYGFAEGFDSGKAACLGYRFRVTMNFPLNMVFLHEMAHVGVNGKESGHGPLFTAELKKLVHVMTSYFVAEEVKHA